jgi:hypothetical protein
MSTPPIGKKIALTEGQKIKGPAIVTGPFNCLLSAFGNNRRRRGFALADVGLRGGCDAKERQRRCRQ